MLTVRAFLATAALALFLSTTAAAQVPTSLPVDIHENSAVKLEAALGHQVSIEADKQPLCEVLQSLADQTNTAILLSKKIEDAGVDPTRPVTKNLKGISLRSALKLILEDLGLSYMIKGEALIVTTIEDTQYAENLQIKVYLVKDLVTTTASEPPKLDFDPLIELITSSIEPDSWEDVGGPGSISGFENASSLVIRQRIGTHEQIAALLTTLRKAKSLQDNSTTPAK